MPIALGMFIVQCLKAKFVIDTLPLHCTIIHVTISEAIVSLEHCLRGMKVAPQPRGEILGGQKVTATQAPLLFTILS